MKKLLILIPRMGGGGAERVVSIIANNLCENYEVQITTLVSDESFYALNQKVKFTSAKYIINRKNKITRLISMGKNFINSIFFIRKTIKIYEPDIVFPLLEEMNIVTYFSTIGLNNFVRISSERNDPTRRNRKLQSILEFIYKKYDMLVCQSQSVVKYYNMIPPQKKIVIPNPVDFSAYPDRVDEDKNKRIVAIGRLRVQKNFRLLIDSFSKIANDYPNVNLIIYGEGPQRKELEEQIEKLKLKDRICLPGASKQILMDIRDATMYVMSSDYEGFPNALIEAIAMGVPSISTDFATGIAHEIITSEVGIVVPCGNSDLMAKAMRILLENEDLRKSIREKGYHVVEQFETSKVVQLWDDLFDNLIRVKR